MERGASILIAGAGPTGLAAAVELSRRGFRPRIVDRGAGPTPIEQSRALGVLPSTLRLMEPSGLTARLVEAGRRLEGAEISLGGRRLAVLSTEGVRHPYPFILCLPQGRTERLMAEWLAGRGIEVEWSVAAVGLRQEESATTVELSTGERVSVDALVAADGSRSALREALGVAWVGQAYEHRFALADLVLDRKVEATRLQARLAPRGGATAVFPLGPDLVRVVGMARTAEETIAAFPGVRSVAWQSEFAVSFRHAERMAAGRVYLAGDAAHVHSPVGARGMNLGIADAATLAFLFEAGREREYEAERLPEARKVLRLTLAMTNAVMNRSAMTDMALRTLLPGVMALPFLRRRVAERVMGLDLEPSWLR